MPVKFAIKLIKFYQATFRHIVPDSCRFEPCCSDYAKEAIEKYGVFQGTWLALKRILRCHPFSGKSGHDPLV